MVTDDPNEARKTLFKALADARRVYDGTQDGGRYGAGLALTAINDYLIEIGAPAELRGPLIGLAAALQDLEYGKLNPMLINSEKLHHRPPQTIAEGQVKAFAAFSLTLLIKAGEQKWPAADRVARAVAKWNFGTVSDVTGKKVATWRDRIKAGNRETDYESHTYYELLHSIKELDIDFRATAHSILKTGPDWIPHPS